MRYVDDAQGRMLFALYRRSKGRALGGSLGAPVAAAWNAIGMSGYAFAQASVGGGHHRVRGHVERLDAAIFGEI